MPVVPVTLTVNGAPRALTLDTRRSLVDALRDDLGLTGAKKACGMGNCGACTVIVDGDAIYGCLTLAVDCEGCEVRTVEGLARDDGALDPVQQAFVDADAFQCGYCTPGQIMSVRALLDREPDPSEDDIVAAISGNLCRCGAYRNIVRAAKLAASRRNGR